MALAILQARMATRRLLGKALAPLHGEPMIWRQIERIRQARTVSRLVVATTADPSDDALASFLVSRGQAVFRGAETNLTDRFMRCLEAAGDVSHIVRIKGDQPFVDPRIVDQAVRLARASGAAYAGNRVDSTFPKGLEVEVARVDALTHAAEGLDAVVAETTSPLAVLRARPDRYPHARLDARRDWSRLDLRVKTHPDLAFARAVYAALHPADPAFGMEDILDLLGSRQDIGRLAAA